MGRRFLENEHDEYDIKKHYYCKLCKDVEITSANKSLQLECETVSHTCFTFYDISYNNVIVDRQGIPTMYHENSTDTFVIMDMDSNFPDHYNVEVSCKFCNTILGWACAYGPRYRGKFFLKKDTLI